MPGATSSVLATSSDALVTSSDALVTIAYPSKGHKTSPPLNDLEHATLGFQAVSLTVQDKAVQMRPHESQTPGGQVLLVASCSY